MDLQSPGLQTAAAPTLHNITEAFELTVWADVEAPCDPTAGADVQHWVGTRAFNLETAMVDIIGETGQSHTLATETSKTLLDLQQRTIAVIPFS